MRKTRPDLDKPLLTVLSFSGGKQSSALLWMVLRGELVPPSQLLVLNADPGMEDSRSYEYVAMMKEKCAEAGVEFITAPGPDLWEDLVMADKSRRIDNPPYFVTNPEGKTGKLRQACTQKYKIAPMDKVVRQVLLRDFGIKLKASPPPKSVLKWIGFHAGEWHRMSGSNAKYSYHGYPLIDMKMEDSHVAGYYLKNNLPKPARSVCNACFANSIPYMRDMHANRQHDWWKAVAVDDAVRNGFRGVDGEVFVNRFRTPLRDLPALNFMPPGYDPEKEKEESCNFGGHCFI